MTTDNCEKRAIIIITGLAGLVHGHINTYLK